MRYAIALWWVLTVSMALQAQEKPIRVVFDVTSKDTATHSAVIRHVALMTKSYPRSTFEVVVYGGALPMVLSDKSTVKTKLAQLAANKNVSFMVCAVTLNRGGGTQASLVPGVGIVPDGILEIVTRQSEGWGYIKESHN